ncbi:TPA: hypothetical protein ACJFV9_004395 [Salmonella enterica subsp. enterica serovar Infantis]
MGYTDKRNKAKEATEKKIILKIEAFKSDATTKARNELLKAISNHVDDELSRLVIHERQLLNDELEKQAIRTVLNRYGIENER